MDLSFMPGYQAAKEKAEKAAAAKAEKDRIDAAKQLETTQADLSKNVADATGEYEKCLANQKAAADKLAACQEATRLAGWKKHNITARANAEMEDKRRKLREMMHPVLAAFFAWLKERADERFSIESQSMGLGDVRVTVTNAESIKAHNLSISAANEAADKLIYRPLSQSELAKEIEKIRATIVPVTSPAIPEVKRFIPAIDRETGNFIGGPTFVEVEGGYLPCEYTGNSPSVSYQQR